MTNENILDDNVTLQVENSQIKETQSYLYLSQKVTLSKNYLKTDLSRRSTWHGRYLLDLTIFSLRTLQTP